MTGWSVLLWLDQLAEPFRDDAQVVRFWLALVNIAWLAPIGVLSLLGRSRLGDRFPNAGMAIPLTGIFVGLAGFSAYAAWGFEPTPNWRTLLSLLIAGCLAIFAAMGFLRWRGYDL